MTTVKGKDVTNLKSIANVFNNFFTNIDPSSYKTNPNSKKQLEKFPTNY